MEGFKSKGKDIFGRGQLIADWINSQREKGLWMYNKRTLSAPGTEVLSMDEYGKMTYGLNFGSADYLGLCVSEEAKEASRIAAEEYGVNAAGSPAAFGAHK